jgi:hypothetical protein
MIKTFGTWFGCSLKPNRRIMKRENTYAKLVEKTKELMTTGNVKAYIQALVILEQARRLQPRFVERSA